MIGFLAALTATASAVSAHSSEAPEIEVCFVLDTTGSMGGLIEGAKAKIWSIANQMIAAEPTPRLKIGLIGYRDRGDDYITKVFGLSEDIDAVYAHLQKFQAAGGGDGPESVNQALAEAASQMSWSPDRKVLKIIFLVGDYPPHMDYDDDVPYTKTCKNAVRKDLIINTIQCGSNAGTTPIWQEIAHAAEGSFVAIGQTGDMEVIASPYDAELARLNRDVGRTIVAYGGASSQRAVRTKQVLAEEAAAPAMADRLAFNSATGKVVQGGGDLVDDTRSGEVDLDELPEAELPEEMKGMSAAEKKQHLAEQSTKRAELQKQIDELLVKRKAYLDAEQARLAAEGRGSAFDQEVTQILRAQAKRKGIEYRSE
jgi:hypothetical protein